MKRMNWLDEKKEEIIKMYRSGIIQDDIADYFNVSRASISRRLLEWCITKQQKRVDIDRNTLYNLYHNKKLSNQKIGDMYGCSWSSIYRRMVRFGIKRRTHSECTDGKLNPFYGKKHNKGSRTKMSLSFKNGRRVAGSNRYGVGAYYDTPNQGRKWTRSGWERKTADYLTNNSVDWYYEYVWLSLGNGSHYLPDFYLPMENKYIEVKGASFDKTAEKLNLACKIYNIEIWGRDKLIDLGII